MEQISTSEIAQKLREIAGLLDDFAITTHPRGGDLQWRYFCQAAEIPPERALLRYWRAYAEKVWVRCIRAGEQCTLRAVESAAKSYRDSRQGEGKEGSR